MIKQLCECSNTWVSMNIIEGDILEAMPTSLKNILLFPRPCRIQSAARMPLTQRATLQHPTCNPPTPNVQPSNTQRAVRLCQPSNTQPHTVMVNSASANTPLPTPPPVHCSCQHSTPPPLLHHIHIHGPVLSCPHSPPTSSATSMGQSAPTPLPACMACRQRTTWRVVTSQHVYF